MLRCGFTLLEFLVVIIIIGILAALALPNFGKAKEHALGKEAIANLKLMAAAEWIFRMHVGTYYPPSGIQGNITNINQYLKLSLTEANWDYSITGGASAFTVSADRQGSGGYLNCVYTLTSANAIVGNEPSPNASCP
jgi:prepilin-type N-terminal cleavage/methylation domain-containing protein